jgi:signal transduction histidine kinase
LQVEACVEVEPLPVIEADPVQMFHLFQNLIENALKFHRPGVPPVVRVYSRRAGEPGIGDRDEAPAQSALSSTIPDPPQPRTPFDLIEIFIEDNGIGFDDAHAGRLFQPFQRLVGRGENGSAEVPGIGIGLAICRRIVERHGGWIHARGAAGQGTTFIVTLPVKGSKILN